MEFCKNLQEKLMKDPSYSENQIKIAYSDEENTVIMNIYGFGANIKAFHQEVTDFINRLD